MKIEIGDRFVAHGVIKEVIRIVESKEGRKFDEIHTRYEDGRSGLDYRYTFEDTAIYQPLPHGEVRVVDPKTGGAKGRKPEAYALVPAAPLAELSKVYGMGAEKYEPWNWAKGYAWNLSLSALYRHIEAFRSRTSRDAESGCHHLAHAAFHLFTLMEFERLKLGTDDRQPFPGALPEQEIDGGGL